MTGEVKDSFRDGHRFRPFGHFRLQFFAQIKQKDYFCLPLIITACTPS